MFYFDNSPFSEVVKTLDFPFSNFFANFFQAHVFVENTEKIQSTCHDREKERVGGMEDLFVYESSG